MQMQEWSYINKTILAPMVRCGTLPLRMVAVEYGCDIVYSPEIIDKGLIRCERVVDEKTGRISFVDNSNQSKQNNKGGMVKSCLITYKDEPLVVQLGTSDAKIALEAAQIVCLDAKAIDINMGCPKHFSIHSGMGSALLVQPEKVSDILKTISSNINIPVTCKIRLLDTAQDTYNLIRLAAAHGSVAVAIHGRHVSDRPRHKPLLSLVAEVISLVRGHKETSTLPIIYNGNIFVHEDIAIVKEATGADSVMIARGAMWNPSVFNKDGMVPVYDVACKYLQKSQETCSNPINTKYTLNQMIYEYAHAIPEYQVFNSSRTFEQLQENLNILKKCDQLLQPYTVPQRCLISEARPTSLMSTAEYISALTAGKNKKKRAHRREIEKLKKRKMI